MTHLHLAEAKTAGIQSKIPTDIMRAVSTALAGASYELDSPDYTLTQQHDEHGCRRIVIDISAGLDGIVHLP